jgi:hypothetical protein
MHMTMNIESPMSFTAHAALPRVERNSILTTINTTIFYPSQTMVCIWREHGTIKAVVFVVVVVV